MTDNQNPAPSSPAPRLQRVVRLADLTAYVGLRRTQIEVLISQGRFPRPVRIGDRAMAWMETELIAWQQERIAERDAGASPQPDRGE
jgi:prophage regulatory protein